ncbi:hypothetical protein ACSNOI_25440, partial [Actinomadura kijaniata]|uniref:hypothetical protein n=1 Tax=Actinomadura kijaniata TaxID=46161 RepID=UPI003F1CAF5F
MNETSEKGHDLRLVAPAAATWLTAALTLGADATLSLLLAGALAVAAATLLIRSTSTHHNPHPRKRPPK